MLSSRENRSESTLIEKSSKKPLDKNEVRSRFQPLDTETTTLLYGICGRFGYLPAERQDGYVLSIDFSDAITDLSNLIKAEEGQVLVKLSEMQIMNKHLVPILLALSRERFPEEILSLLDLILILTSGNVTAEKAPADVLLDARRQYKKSFEGTVVFDYLLGLAISSVTSVSEENYNMLNSIFTLTRNILAIPDPNITYKSANITLASSFGRQERVIESMRKSRFLEFLFVSCSSCNDKRDGLIFGPHVPILIEICQFLFCNLDPDSIASMYDFNEGGPQPSQTERSLQKEPKIKRPVRHSRFSGSFVVRLSTGEDYVMAGKRLDGSVNLDDIKRPKPQRTKINIADYGANSVVIRSCERRMMYELAIEFIKEPLNELVRNLNDRGDRLNFPESLNSSIFNLMAWSLRFFRQLQFKDNPPLKFEQIYELIEGNHLVNCARNLRRLLDEKQYKNLLFCVIFFRESLRILDILIHSSDKSHIEMARDIESIFFYHQDVISIFRIVLQNSKKFSVTTLSILIETNHVLLKLLKEYCNLKGHVFVTNPKKNQKTTGNIGENDDDEEEEEGEEAYNEKEFIFDYFLADFANESVLESYIRSFRNALNNDPPINRYLASMFAGFITKVKVPFILYRVSILECCHEVIAGSSPLWRRKNPDLVKISQFIAKSFITELQKDPSLLISSFFANPIAQRKSRYDSDHARNKVNSNLEVATIPEHWSNEERIRWLVRSLVNIEKSSAISWLCGKIFDAASSRMDFSSKDDPIAEDYERPNFYLYAQTDSLKEAIENPQMRRLLIEIGAMMPDEKDDSWRIPSTIEANELIGRANLVQSALRDAVASENDGVIKTFNNRPNCQSSESEMGEDISENEPSSEENSDTPSPNPLSKWENLKRNHFFLNVPVEKGETDMDEHEQGIIKPKRPPLAIYSDDEGD